MEKGIEQIRPRLILITQRRAQSARVQENRAVIDYQVIESNGSLAYTVQIERRKLTLPGQTEPTDNILRATHVIRKENGEWKLLHRHADELVNVTIPGLAPASPIR